MDKYSLADQHTFLALTLCKAFSAYFEGDIRPMVGLLSAFS